MWPDLLKTALLGTEKSQFSDIALPESVREALAMLPTADPEGRLLTAAALVRNRDRAAQIPDTLEAVTFASAPDETAKIAAAEYTALLEPIFVRPDFYAPLLAILLEKIRSKGYILPPVWLVRVLNAGTTKAFRPYQSLIVATIGRRGQWLQQFNPAWKFVPAPAPDAANKKRLAQKAALPAPEWPPQYSDANLETFLLQSPNGALSVMAHWRQLVRPDWHWSATLSRRIVQDICTPEFALHHPEMVLESAMHLHASVTEDIARLAGVETQNWTEAQAQKRVMRPLLTFLQIKEQINQLK